MQPTSTTGAAPRCAVAAWIGSANLGDELVFAALARQLAERGLDPVALSVDPATTSAAHGVAAVRRRDLLRGSVGVATVLGGGGLLQDETSTLNLDLHLSPVVAARLRREPVVGVGLGAGRLTTRTGRLRVRSALGGVPLAVRDTTSAEVLRGLGLEPPIVAADLTVSLPPPDVAPVERIVACLRPWSGRRHRVPARLRRHRSPDAFVAGAAGALDRLVDDTGLPVHLVAFDAPKDGPLHEAVAQRMRHAPTLSTPDVSSVVGEVAASRLVVSMRYHGGMAAVLGGRPSVLIGYTTKVSSLADDIGPGAAAVRFDAGGVVGLTEAAARVLGRDPDVEEARARLRDRERGNGRVLDELAASVGAGRGR